MAKRWINTRVVIDMENDAVLKKEGYFYDGPLESCDPVTIALIASIAASSAAAGSSIYKAQDYQGPSTKPSGPAGPQPLSAGQNAAQQASVTGALPTLQALTGGSLSPEYATQYGTTQTGLENNPQATGNIQAAINQFFGLSAPGSTGLTASSATGGGTNSIVDLLNKSGTGGGGSKLTGGGGGGGSMIDSLLSGDMFRGLVAA